MDSLQISTWIFEETAAKDESHMNSDHDMS